MNTVLPVAFLTSLCNDKYYTRLLTSLFTTHAKGLRVSGADMLRVYS
jgi:hypothetical protein